MKDVAARRLLCHRPDMVKGENRPLTALRGVAALWVVAHHLLTGWGLGAAGVVGGFLLLGHSAVDIFFVLSGFILTRVHGVLRVDQVSDFWLRRLYRVYPLHLAIMAALGVAALLAELRHPALPPHDWASFPAVAAMMQSFLLDHLAWNGMTWSVGVELVCYALFPVSVRLLGRMSPMARWLAVPLLAISESVVLQAHDGALDGWGACLRGLFGFHLGMALAWLPAIPAARHASLSLIGVAGLGAAAASGSVTGVVMASALLILALDGQQGLVAGVLSQPLPVWLGRISFSVYLLHGPLMGALTRVPLGPSWRAALLLTLLLPAATVTHRFIEEPARRLPMRVAARPRRPAEAAFPRPL